MTLNNLKEQIKFEIEAAIEEFLSNSMSIRSCDYNAEIEVDGKELDIIVNRTADSILTIMVSNEY